MLGVLSVLFEAERLLVRPGCFPPVPPVKAVVEANRDQMDFRLYPAVAVGAKVGDIEIIIIKIVVIEPEVIVLDPGRPIAPQAKFNTGASRPAPARTALLQRIESGVVDYGKLRHKAGEAAPLEICYRLSTVSTCVQSVVRFRPSTAAFHVPQRPVLRARCQAEAPSKQGDILDLAAEPTVKTRVHSVEGVTTGDKGICRGRRGVTVRSYVRKVEHAFEAYNNGRVRKLPIVADLEAAGWADASLRTEPGIGVIKTTEVAVLVTKLLAGPAWAHVTAHVEPGPVPQRRRRRNNWWWRFPR